MILTNQIHNKQLFLFCFEILEALILHLQFINITETQTCNQEKMTIHPVMSHLGFQNFATLM